MSLPKNYLILDNPEQFYLFLLLINKSSITFSNLSIKVSMFEPTLMELIFSAIIS